ncbi:MAG: hypothetical protein A3H32_16645 [Betaproteobacteria bacterium RIFCSPLOWO2_02_FULL_63_19]|nr:MAG: hypothetical protein A3H32_16645 [Betaproteobacteria bacterium RIFCSPLOWO2_02_FULL_63_19]
MSAPDDEIAYHLSFRDVIRVLQLVDASPFLDLKLEIGALKVHVTRERGGEAPAPSAAADTAQSKGARGEFAESPAEPLAPERREVPEGTPVVAPLAGTFYRAPYPGQPPFVEVGSAVEKGAVVGILEIMKLMNNVLAPCAGVIAAICAENEAFVEVNQVLAIVAPRDQARGSEGAR